MSDPTDKLKEIASFIKEVGVPACILGLILYYHFHDTRLYQRMVDWKMERIVRNTRAIMQKLEIPVVFDNDKKEDQ